MRKIFFLPLFLFLVVYLFYSRHSLFHPKEKKLTQITNNESFRNMCVKAVEDSAQFSFFKQDPIYTIFYENTTQEEGEFFLSEIKKNFSKLLQLEVLQQVSILNEVGGPRLYPFEELGLFSPTLLRYLALAGKLEDLFASLQGWDIVEIGGNGGLCKVLSELFEIKSYTIIDFPESLALTKKHLEALGVANVFYCTAEEYTKRPCDLVLSEYSFTESHSDLQKKYVKSIISVAKHGYLICNFYSKAFLIKPLEKIALLQIISSLHPKYSLMPEIPCTGKDNCIITWED